MRQNILVAFNIKVSLASIRHVAQENSLWLSYTSRAGKEGHYITSCYQTLLSDQSLTKLPSSYW